MFKGNIMFRSLLFIFVSIFILSGCGGGTSDQDTEIKLVLNTKEESDKKTSYFELNTIDSNKNQIELLLPEEYSQKNIIIKENISLNIPSEYEYITKGFIQINTNMAEIAQSKIIINPIDNVDSVFVKSLNSNVKLFPFYREDDGTISINLLLEDGIASFALVKKD